MADDPYADALTTTAQTPSSDPYASASIAAPTATPAPTNGFGSGGFGAQSVSAGAGNAVKNIGRALVAGHKDPIGTFLDKTQGGQRMLQSVGMQLLGHAQNPDGSYVDPFKALMEPSMKAPMQLGSDQAMGIDPQGPITQLLGGTTPNLAQKIGQGATHAVADGVTNPLSYVAPAKVAKFAADAIPGVGAAANAIGSGIANSPLGQGFGALFSGNHYIRGLTPEGQAQYEAITNKAMENVRAQKAAEDALVAQPANAAAIRNGQMPDEIAKLFTPAKGQSADTAWQQYFPEGLQVGTRPQDVQMALFNNRAPLFKAQAMPELQNAGFFESPSSLAAKRSMGGTDMFDVPTEGLASDANHPINEIQTRLENNLSPKPAADNAVAKLFAKGTQLGNQAFLANPVPHMFNLSDLAYNKYGLPTMLKGIANGARVATGTVGNGDLASSIAENAANGTNSQYANIFDELGLTGLKNSSATNPLATAYNATLAPASRAVAQAVNVPLVAAQRASNAAQNTLLNPLETGLRAAALDAEKNAGSTPLQAAKNIHETFGTGAPNAIVSGLQKAAVPFAGFHYQTAPASVASAALNNPGRIVNTLQTERDMDNALGTNYRSTVPGANAARMITDSPNYFGNAGGVLGAEGPFSMLTQLKKGELLKVIQNAATKFTPGSQPGIDAAKVGAGAFNAMVNGTPAPSYAPLFNAAFGGYTAK